MSQMIKVDTADLSGPALNWAVAKETDASQVKVVEWGDGNTVSCVYQLADGGCWANHYSPSTEWDQGGALIHRYGCDLNCVASANCWESACWDDDLPTPDLHLMEGETPLIAACRAIVAAKLGDTVQVPAELVTP
jgi:hypothetical protein